MRQCLFILMLTACLSGCDELLPEVLEPVPFTLEMTPTQIVDSIVGQKIVLLATVTDDETRPWPTGLVRLSATADDATVTVVPTFVIPGQVAEITVVPATPKNGNEQLIPNEEGGWMRDVQVSAERFGVQRSATVPVRVVSDEPDLVGPLAAEVRDLFLPWLAENRPELGIGPTTAWTGTIVTPHILVVNHYLYFSAEWELHVFWHVMIPPYDWARIELRRRFEETTPSLAFEIPSRSATPLEVNEIEPEDTLWR